jgi:hypothetical protein
MYPSPTEWLPASLAPPDTDLEVCVLALDDMVHALSFPCHKVGSEWVDASGNAQTGLEPTHCRRWS